MSLKATARAISVVGHPALLMPGAAAWAASIKNAPPHVLHAGVGASIFIAVTVGVYSVVQVRAGRWKHVDASVPHERRQLNLLLVVLLLGAACLLWWSGQPRPISLGLAIGGGLVAFAYLLRTWLTVSLHVAFAVLAASLLWPSFPAVLTILVLAAGVSWSRLLLRRHTPAEVVLGFLAGGTAGVAFNLVAVEV